MTSPDQPGDSRSLRMTSELTAEQIEAMKRAADRERIALEKLRPPEPVGGWPEGEEHVYARHAARLATPSSANDGLIDTNRQIATEGADDA